MRRRKEKQRQSRKFRMTRDPEPVIAIATPMQDLCHSAYTASLIHLVAHTLTSCPGINATFLNYGTSILPFSRQLLAKQAMEIKATHVLWIDSDMTFPADMIIRMLRYQHPIVGINAMARRPPYRCTAQTENEEQLHTTADSSGLEKASRVGLGVMWTAMEVFHAIDLPWFDFEFVPEKYVFRGEDYYFCEKAKAAGYEIYVDHDLSKEVEHIGSFGFSPLLRDSALVSATDQGDTA